MDEIEISQKTKKLLEICKQQCNITTDNKMIIHLIKEQHPDIYTQTKGGNK